MTAPRWYVRCPECFSDGYIDREAPPPAGATCGACGLGGVQTVGRVERGRVYASEERCACDSRCTYARGVKCECSCGGANHGAGSVIVDAYQGDAPLALRRGDPDRARSWHAWRASVRAFLEDVRPVKAPGGWLPPEQFARLRRCGDVSAAVHEAHAARTWKGRASRSAFVVRLIAGTWPNSGISAWSPTVAEPSLF